MQIIATTHSPLVLGSVRHDRVHVLRVSDGVSRVERPKETTWGRSADQLLASPYFGLDTARDERFVVELRDAEKKASEGSLEDAIEYARLLARGGEQA